MIYKNHKEWHPVYICHDLWHPLRQEVPDARPLTSTENHRVHKSNIPILFSPQNLIALYQLSDAVIQGKSWFPSGCENS